jgi:hypothetical protein
VASPVTFELISKSYYITIGVHNEWEIRKGSYALVAPLTGHSALSPEPARFLKMVVISASRKAGFGMLIRQQNNRN